MSAGAGRVFKTGSALVIRYLRRTTFQLHFTRVGKGDSRTNFESDFVRPTPSWSFLTGLDRAELAATAMRSLARGSGRGSDTASLPGCGSETQPERPIFDG